MTKRSDTGSGSRRTALDLQDVHIAQAKLINAAVNDLTDGDNDTRTALKALNELGLMNMLGFDVQVSIADGALLDAEMAAQRLAAGKSGVL